MGTGRWHVSLQAGASWTLCDLRPKAGGCARAPFPGDRRTWGWPRLQRCRRELGRPELRGRSRRKGSCCAHFLCLLDVPTVHAPHLHTPVITRDTLLCTPHVRMTHSEPMCVHMETHAQVCGHMRTQHTPTYVPTETHLNGHILTRVHPHAHARVYTLTYTHHTRAHLWTHTQSFLQTQRSDWHVFQLCGRCTVWGVLVSK